MTVTDRVVYGRQNPGQKVGIEREEKPERSLPGVSLGEVFHIEGQPFLPGSDKKRNLVKHSEAPAPTQQDEGFAHLARKPA